MPLSAQLARLTDPALQEKTERYVSFRDGGGGIILREDVVINNATVDEADGALAINATADGAIVEATSKGLNLPDDWRPYGQLRSSITSREERIHVEFSVLGARNRIVQSAWIEAGSSHEFLIDLHDLPLAAGKRPPFCPTGIKLQIRWGNTYPTEGEWVKNKGKWPDSEGNTPIDCVLTGVELIEREEGQPVAVVDGFGQRLNGTWPTKVSDDEHFAAVKAEEEEWLKNTAAPSERDRFGGWSAGPQLEATGFFRVTEYDGRWWYVDPDGYLFWSVGTTGIRVSDTTQLEDREELFTTLPERDGPQAQFYDPPIGSPANDGRGKEVVSFYLLNVLRKYGNLETWRDRVIERFQTVGYNTFGNWSDELMMEQRLVPHTRALSSRVGPKLKKGNLPNIFHPEWEIKLTEHFNEMAAPNKDNPWLLGYFVDNEMGWGGLPRNVLLADKGDPIRQAFASYLSTHFDENLAAACADLQTDADSFELLADAIDDSLPTGEEQPAVLTAFAGYYAERYFATVNRLLKEADPNHLYLGCRFVRRKPSDDICAAAGRHCDVVTVNCYSLTPAREEFEGWFKATGRPIQIGEHHLPLRSNRQLQPLYPAFTSEERRDCYEEFLNVWMDQPYSLGAHWFQHADQNATGRPIDGENQTVGFVDITDRPHPELVDAAMVATRAMYHRHAEAE